MKKVTEHWLEMTQEEADEVAAYLFDSEAAPFERIAEALRAGAGIKIVKKEKKK